MFSSGKPPDEIYAQSISTRQREYCFYRFCTMEKIKKAIKARSKTSGPDERIDAEKALRFRMKTEKQ